MPQISTVSPGRSAAAGRQHPPGGERGERERGGLGPRHRRRAPAPGSPRARRRTRPPCRAGARPTTRKVAQSDSSPCQAGGAPAAREPGVDHDPVARPRPADRGPDRLDDPGAVRAHDVRERVAHARQAVGDEQVEAVERRGAAPARARRPGASISGAGSSRTARCSSPPMASSARALIGAASLRTTGSAPARRAGAGRASACCRRRAAGCAA